MGITEDRDDFFTNPSSRLMADHDDNKQYAVAQSPDVTPAGTVWVPELGTYVDADIAKQVSRDDPGFIFEDDDVEYVPNPEAFEIGPDDQGDEFDRLDDDEDEDEDEDEPQEKPKSNSETLDQLEEMAPPGTSEAVEQSIISGDFDGVLDNMASSLGIDTTAASTLIGQTVAEAQPDIVYEIGDEAFNALSYAASRTDDPMARQVLNDMVRGRIPKGRLMQAYHLWWQSLPDAN